MNKKNDIIDSLLINQPILSIGRVSAMVWIGFGKTINYVYPNGQGSIKTSIALHIQSMFRIRNKKGEILFSNNDIYSPRTNIVNDNDFDWDKNGNNLFDEKSSIWSYSFSNTYVKDYNISLCGDLFINLSNDDTIEIYIDVSDNTECWRLFKIGKKIHFIMRGQEYVIKDNTEAN